jgi:hypothetical protein
MRIVSRFSRGFCHPFCYVLAAAVIISSCGSTSTESITGPGGPKCSVALTAPSAIAPDGGSASVTVSTQPECEWTASAEAGWITNLTPAQGQGNGEVQFQAAPNPNGAARDGAIAINGQRATIRQSGAVCQFSAAADVVRFSAAGGAGSIALASPGGCSWTAASSVSWITVSPRSGSGSATLAFTVSRNVGVARNGVITVAEVAVSISQDSASGDPAPTPGPSPTPGPTPAPSPCTVTLQPVSTSIAATGGSGSIGVTANAGCQWTATEQATWLTLSNASGAGNGSVGFSVAANPGPAARSATVTVGGATFTINQPAPVPVCAPSITQASITVGDEDITGLTVAVTADGGCTWTATSNAGWLQITSGSSGSGSGTVTYDVSKGSSRSGTMTIAGQIFTVTQVKCSATLNPTTQDVPAAGGSFSVSVTTQVGCGWQVSESLNWVSVTSGNSGTGSATVTYTVSPNTGHGDRKGNLSIAGRTLSVNQAGAP